MRSILIFVLALIPVLGQASSIGLGTGNYLSLYFERQTTEIRWTEDFFIFGPVKKLTPTFRIGAGTGMMRHTFSATSPSPGEVEGFERKKDKKVGLAIFAEYSKRWFFSSLTITQANFSVNRSRLRTETFDPGPPPRIIREYEREITSYNDAEVLFTVGVRYEF